MRLVVRFDGVDVHDYVFDKKNITIGRTKENDITIDNMAVSGKHAAIQVTGDGPMVVDMNSTNGVYVNDKKITQQPLKERDVITIGKHQIVYYADENAAIAMSSDATVMMSPDFQKQLQSELNKNKAAKQPKKSNKESGGFFAGIKKLFGIN